MHACATVSAFSKLIYCKHLVAYFLHTVHNISTSYVGSAEVVYVITGKTNIRNQIVSSL